MDQGTNLLQDLNQTPNDVWVVELSESVLASIGGGVGEIAVG